MKSSTQHLKHLQRTRVTLSDPVIPLQATAWEGLEESLDALVGTK